MGGGWQRWRACVVGAGWGAGHSTLFSKPRLLSRTASVNEWEWPPGKRGPFGDFSVFFGSNPVRNLHRRKSCPFFFPALSDAACLGKISHRTRHVWAKSHTIGQKKGYDFSGAHSDRQQTKTAARIEGKMAPPPPACPPPRRETPAAYFFYKKSISCS